MACLRCYVFLALKYLAFQWKFQQEGVGLFEGVLPYISYMKRYIQIIEMFKYEIEQDFLNSGTGVRQDMLFYHSTFKGNSLYLKQGRKNHMVWTENTKMVSRTCWTLIYCNPTISYSNYLALIHRGYHYFVFLKISVQLLGILSKYFNTPVCILLNQKLKGIQFWLKTGNLQFYTALWNLV